MEEQKQKKSVFDNPMLSTKIKSAKTTFFPEGVLGYFLGPTFALLTNSVLSSYFNKYLTDVLDMYTWANTFVTWLPVVSVIFVVIGNIAVGKLMDHNRTRAGKARPLLLVSIPLAILALLFLFIISPFATAESSSSEQLASLIFIAIGYNLWFAVAYPFYFTSHSALVNLSTRSSKDRSLLATMSNATTLAAMGLVSMVGSFFLGLLFVTDDAGVVDASASYSRWKIFIIILMVVNFLGVLLEYYFTRERITEESLASGDAAANTKKAVPTSVQAKACFKDKFWWIMMAFFFLYQFGGMMKNVSQLYFCSALFPIDGVYSTVNGGIWNGTLAIIGAIPTALGMLIAWPLSNKIGKRNAIVCGAVISVIGGCIGFIAPDNFYVVVASFVIKALGSTPAMYLQLALLADVLDHQEAKNKFRTDGFTMTVYGAIMAGMTGLTTGVLNIVLNVSGYTASEVSSSTIQTAMTWVFIGAETICYAVIFIIMLFMRVEKYGDEDHKTIRANQKAECEARGEVWIEPEERMRLEEEEVERQTEIARVAELKAKCEKKGLSFEEEEAKYQAKLAEQKKKAAEKEAARIEKLKAKGKYVEPEPAPEAEAPAASETEAPAASETESSGPVSDTYITIDAQTGEVKRETKAGPPSEEWQRIAAEQEANAAAAEANAAQQEKDAEAQRQAAEKQRADVEASRNNNK